jgi:peptide/nickel transport system ATP-binding protein
MSLLEIAGLTSGFVGGDGRLDEVLHDVSLAVRTGEIAGLIGESGSGKSVTAKTVLRLLSPRAYRVRAGTVCFEGSDVLGLDTEAMRALRGRRIGYIPQEPMNALNPTARIGAQLAMVLREHFNLAAKEARARAAAVLEKMHVADPERILASYPFQLSGGLRQRVTLANAFLCEPDLLIADEPTTALDVTIQAEVLQILAERARDSGAAVLFITHNMGVVWRLCETVWVMRYGRIVESGPTARVLSKPANPYTAALLDALPERNPPRAPIPVAGRA